MPADPLAYRIDYVVKPHLVDGTVEVTLTLSQDRALLREMTMRPDARVADLKANGELRIGDTEVRWLPPASGGTMSWRVNVANQRNGDGHDAWLGMEWGLFRAEDIIPRATTRTLKRARSETWLTLRLPAGWTAVTQYFNTNGRIRIDNPQRRFDQPSGWMLFGDLGIRRETIAGMRVAVAGPIGQSVRRMDALALLNWTLPELRRLLPDLPARLTIISAGDPMWRGGLSAPQSLFIHADRPLISENGTSTLLHEVMHLTLALGAAEGYDWIVEGLAEYYSLQLLHRSGTISNSRFKRAKADLAEWAASASSLCRRNSTAATTALAVGILTALDEDIRQLSAGQSSLDDVLSELTQLEHDIDLHGLSEISQRIAGGEPDALHIEKLPGCHNKNTSSRET